jgi:hypothetical protein
VEIPTAVAAVGQLRAALFEALPSGVPASAPFEDHTLKITPLLDRMTATFRRSVPRLSMAT